MFRVLVTMWATLWRVDGGQPCTQSAVMNFLSGEVVAGNQLLCAGRLESSRQGDDSETWIGSLVSVSSKYLTKELFRWDNHCGNE